MRILNNQCRGVSSLAAMLTLLSLLVAGYAIVYLVAAGQTGGVQHLLSSKAFYVTQAGIEYAVKKIYDGEVETVAAPGINFADGSFTVSRSGRTLTITAVVAETTRIQKVDSPTEADCTELDAGNVNLHEDGKKISGITFRKICLTQITIDKIIVSWIPNDGQKVRKIRIESSTIYDNPSGASSGTLLEVQDYIVTNPNNNIINEMKFDQSVEETDMTLTFQFADQTQKSVTFEVDD